MGIEPNSRLVRDTKLRLGLVSLLSLSCNIQNKLFCYCVIRVCLPQTLTNEMCGGRKMHSAMMLCLILYLTLQERMWSRSNSGPLRISTLACRLGGSLPALRHNGHIYSWFEEQRKRESILTICYCCHINNKAFVYKTLITPPSYSSLGMVLFP